MNNNSKNVIITGNFPKEFSNRPVIHGINHNNSMFDIDSSFDAIEKIVESKYLLTRGEMAKDGSNFNGTDYISLSDMAISQEVLSKIKPQEKSSSIKINNINLSYIKYGSKRLSLVFDPRQIGAQNTILEKDISKMFTSGNGNKRYSCFPDEVQKKGNIYLPDSTKALILPIYHMKESKIVRKPCDKKILSGYVKELTELFKANGINIQIYGLTSILKMNLKLVNENNINEMYESISPVR